MATRPSKVYVNDIGTVILLDVGSDITGATVANIKVQKPDGLEYIWIGSIYEKKYVKYVILGPVKGYQTCGLVIESTDDTGLLPNTIYYFKVNNIQYSITTGSGVVTYADLVTLMDASLNTAGFDVIISNNDIRVDARLNSTLIEDAINATVLLADGDSTLKLFENLSDFTEFNDPVDPFLGDLDQHGMYYLQAYVEVSSWKGRGETVELEVYKKFK